MGKAFLHLKIWGMTDHSCPNYESSNFLFGFNDTCIGHLNKMQTKVAVMLKVHISEIYSEIKTLLKV